MNLTVEILFTDLEKDEQTLAGTISASGDKLKISPKEKEYEDFFQRLEDEFNEGNEGAEDFVNSLTQRYSGSVVRARLVNLSSEDEKVLRKAINETFS
jgi:hypothetical protein